MTIAQRIAAKLAVGISVAAAGPSLAQIEPETSAANQSSQSILEEAIEDSKTKLADEINRVPGLTYDDISKISRKIPGRVQIPDPTSKDSTTRAVSVPGGLVSQKCKHFARGYIARRLAKNDPGLTHGNALSKVMKHLQDQPTAYAKIAGPRGLKRSDGAIHDANCPICGPLNVVEIECHKATVKKSPIRQLLLFDYDSDVLRGGHLVTIDEIKALLDKDLGLQVALIGRASLPGGPVSNFELSARRIASVWQGLAKAGVPIDRIIAIPIGEDEPHLDLQLAIDYGLERKFADLGQKPLNQSVYVVVFRPDEKSTSDAPETSGVLQSNAMIEVTVSNAEGSELLQGVSVTAVSDQNMQSTSVNTDANGKGYLRNLEKGNWTIYFEREGYVTKITEINLVKGEKKFNSVTLRTADAEDVPGAKRTNPPLARDHDGRLAAQTSIISQAAAIAVRTESRSGNSIHLRTAAGDVNVGEGPVAPMSPKEFSVDALESATLRNADAEDAPGERRTNPPLAKDRNGRFSAQPSIISQAAAIAVRTESRNGNPIHLRAAPGDVNVGEGPVASGSPAEFSIDNTELASRSPSAEADETAKETQLQSRLKGTAPPTDSRVQSRTLEKQGARATSVKSESSTAMVNARRLAEKLRERQNKIQAANDQRQSVEKNRGGVTRNQGQHNQADSGLTTDEMTEAEKILRRAFMAKW